MSAANIEEIVVGLETYTDVPTSIYRSSMNEQHMSKYLTGEVELIDSK
jgi:hypothetical protein